MAFSTALLLPCGVPADFDRPVSPPARDLRAPVIPFSLGASFYVDDIPLTCCPYEPGTPEAARFTAGWHAAASVADGEADDIEREAAADARAASGDTRE